MWIQRVKRGVEGLAYSPDGRLLFVTDAFANTAEWDVSTRKSREICRAQFGAKFGMFSAAGGRYLVMRGPGASIWDRETGAEYAKLEVTEQPETSVGKQHSICPLPGDDSKLLVKDADSASVRAWDIATQTFSPFGNFGAAGPFDRFSITPDARTIALLHGESANVVLVDLTSGRQLDTRPAPEKARQLLFSPDGAIVAVTNPDRLWLWHIPSARFAQVKSARVAPSKRVLAWPVFAFHPSAPMFLALNEEGIPTLFDLTAHKPLRSLDFSVGKYTECAAFSPDGLTCAIGGSNKRFAVFDVDV